MNMNPIRHFCLRHQQQGVTLIVSLIFMIVLTLFVTAGVRTTLMQERMSGYSWEQNMAFQAAEFGARHGESYLATDAPPATFMSSTCLGGLCKMGYMPDWADTSVWAAANSANYKEVGATTGAWANLGIPLADKPKFIIEYAGGTKRLKDGPEGGKVDVYRVMARGVGKSASSQAFVVSTYLP